MHRRTGVEAAYGTRSKQTLSNLVFGRTVRVEDHGRDRYGRLLGRVCTTGILDANAEMVREGAAWVYVRYCHDPELYRLEKDARDAKRGAVGSAGGAQRVAPWEWEALRAGGGLTAPHYAA